MNYTFVIGLIAGLTTTLSFVPQIIKTIKTKETSNISLHMYIFYTMGILLWYIYAIEINALAIIITNTISLICGLIMLYMKINYR